ncbi:MAG: deoxyribonuclease IV [Spirochaetota bacterium]
MRELGCHVSIAGGYHRAVARGEKLGCTAIQIFTRSQLQWSIRPLDREAVERWHRARNGSTVRGAYAHGSYLINLASPDGRVAELSRSALLEELSRCRALGIPLLVIHPGFHLGSGQDRGAGRVAASLRRALRRVPGVWVCLENTAGQGTGLGFRFEQLGEIIGEAGERVGVCLDTCHAFAAGYDLRDPRGLSAALDGLDRAAGLHLLKLLHLNDCRGDLGSRVDRHQHIGQGALGREAFRLVLHSGELEGIPAVIETPKGRGGEEGERMDRENLRLLRELAGEGQCAS